jgi:hypothetical protein
MKNKATIVDRDRAIAEHKLKRDSVIRLAETRHETNVKKAKDKYSIRIKRLRNGPRSPVFILKFSKQPDWDQYEDMPANKKPFRKKERPTRATEKWKIPLRWRRLKINMTVEQVHTMLGEPEKNETNVRETREYYGDVPSHGELCFTVRPDSQEYLDSWVEPFWPAAEKSLYAENEPDTGPKDEQATNNDLP